MGFSAFQKGVLVEIDGQQFKLLHELENNLWQLQNLRSGRIQEIALEALQRSYVEGRLIFVSDAAPRLGRLKSESSQSGKAVREMPSPEVWEEAKIRRTYVLGVLNEPATPKVFLPIIQEKWEQLKKSSTEPPSFSTVYRWRMRYIESGGDIFSLLDSDSRKGNFERKADEKVIELVKEAIETTYLTRERKTMADTLNHASILVKNENKLRPSSTQLKLPTRSLVRKAIEDFPAFDRYAARYGRNAAVRKFRSVLGHRMTEEPLQRAEIDHLNLDLMVIDDRTLMPLGRPWYTGCEDDHTRCQLGMNLGFQPPSHLTVARCLKHALLPKIGLREQYPEIQNEWLAHGVMQTLVVDNGLEFHGQSLEAACYSLDIEIEYSPRKTPWYKGKIERYFRSLNDGVAHGQPGTTFNNIFEKDDYDPEKHAVIRLSTLKKIIHLWIADVYHQKEHRALGISPAAMWKACVNQNDIPLPDDPSRLDAILGRIEFRRLTHKGVELDGLLYNSIELSDLRRSLGDILDVVLRVDDGDLGHVWVLTPDQSRMFRVPALKFEYANGLTAWQHRVCKQFSKRIFDRSDADVWMEAKELIARLVQEDMLVKRKGTNALLGRHLEDCTPKPPSTIAGAQAEAVPINKGLAKPVSEIQTAPSQNVKNTSADQPLSAQSFSRQEPERTRYKPIIEDSSVSSDSCDGP